MRSDRTLYLEIVITSISSSSTILWTHFINKIQWISRCKISRSCDRNQNPWGLRTDDLAYTSTRTLLCTAIDTVQNGRLKPLEWYLLINFFLRRIKKYFTPKSNELWCMCACVWHFEPTLCNYERIIAIGSNKWDKCLIISLGFDGRKWNKKR